MANTQAPNAALSLYREGIKSRKCSAILKAAHETFLAEGFSRAQMSSISERADVSTATLYKHFRSKEDLFMAVLKQAYQTTDENSRHQLGDADAKSEIFRLMKAFALKRVEQKADILLHIAGIEVASAAEFARDIFKAQSLSRHHELRMLLQQLIERGDLRRHDTDLGAHQISGMINEMLARPHFYGDEDSLSADTDDIIAQSIETYLSRFAGASRPRGDTETSQLQNHARAVAPVA